MTGIEDHVQQDLADAVLLHQHDRPLVIALNVLKDHFIPRTVAQRPLALVLGGEALAGTT